MSADVGACDATLLRPASSSSNLRLNEDANACDEWSLRCTTGQGPRNNDNQTVLSRGDQTRNCDHSQGGTLLPYPVLEQARTAKAGGVVDSERSHDKEQAVQPVRPANGAWPAGFVLSKFACAGTKVRGGGDPVVSGSGKSRWGDSSTR